MTPTPAPLEVILRSGPSSGWDILAALGPLAVLLGAIIAAVIGWETLKQRRAADAKALAQKRRADDRSEWWRRTQWALDRAVDATPATKALGLAALEVLARSELAHQEELELFDIAWKSVTDTTAVAAGGPLQDRPSAPPRLTWDTDAGHGDPGSGNAGHTPRHSSAAHTIQQSGQQRLIAIAASRLRVTLDGRLERPTPSSIQALAKEPL